MRIARSTTFCFAPDSWLVSRLIVQADPRIDCPVTRLKPTRVNCIADMSPAPAARMEMLGVVGLLALLACLLINTPNLHADSDKIDIVHEIRFGPAEPPVLAQRDITVRYQTTNTMIETAVQTTATPLLGHPLRCMA